MYSKKIEEVVDHTVKQGDCVYEMKEYNLAFLYYHDAIETEKRNRNRIKKMERLGVIFAKRGMANYKLELYKKCLEDFQCSLAFLKQFHHQKEILLEVQKLRKILIEICLKTDVNVSWK